MIGRPELEVSMDPSNPATICYENCIEWLGVNMPVESTNLRLQNWHPDRCFFAVDSIVVQAARTMKEDGVLEQRYCGNHGRNAFVGYRENIDSCSAQLVFHSDAKGNYVMEMDFDYHNPWDVVGIFRHGWEVFRNKIGKRKTDPFKVRKALEKRGYFEAHTTTE